MIQSLNPYSCPSKTAEIMSRYRPIAPRPALPSSSRLDGSLDSQKIQQSPYLRSLWPQLQDRPTRTRKRGRTALSPATLKRARTHPVGLSSPSHGTSLAKNLSLQGFVHGFPQLSMPVAVSVSVSSSGLAVFSGGLEISATCPTSGAVSAKQDVSELQTVKPSNAEKVIDLNRVAEIPEERDLLQLLQRPHGSNVIAPQPVRPIGSSISVSCICEETKPVSVPPPPQAPKWPEEVEEEIESDALPAVISDSNNKVRLANSAYKEMVGQPECSWLDSMANSDGRLGGSSSKRLSGEVMLNLSDSRMPLSSDGFSCWVRIDWESNGKKNSINAFCNVIRLCCESKDYVFMWRLHTHNIRKGTETSS